MGYRIDVNDLSLDQLDQVNRLVESGRCGKVVAVAFVAIKAEDPSVTLDQVRNMRQGDIELIKTVVTEDQDDDDALGHTNGH
jgi:predicted SnoaL-like aldol condensation-catalyzing enzyme